MHQPVLDWCCVVDGFCASTYCKVEFESEIEEDRHSLHGKYTRRRYCCKKRYRYLELCMYAWRDVMVQRLPSAAFDESGGIRVTSREGSCDVNLV